MASCGHKYAKYESYIVYNLGVGQGNMRLVINGLPVRPDFQENANVNI